jgi:hypothetical protein
LRLLPGLLSLVSLAVGYQGFTPATAHAQLTPPPDSHDAPNVVVETAPQTASRIEPPSVLAQSVHVHIDSPSPVNLQRKGDDKRHPFYSICTSPCDTDVPADGEYRIGGDGAPDTSPDGSIGSFDVRPSHRFSLPRGLRHDTIVVEPRSQAAFSGGIALTVLGGLALGVAALWAVAAAFGSFDEGTPSMTGPVVMAAGGGAAVVGGVILIVLNRSTHSLQLGDPTSRLDLPWRHAGTSREEPLGQRAMASPPGAPLFRIVF